MGEIVKNKWRESFWFKFLTVDAIILLVVSFIIPPAGIIDPSVLAAVGEIEALAALWIVYKAVQKGTGAHISKGDINIDIDKEEEE